MNNRIVLLCLLAIGGISACNKNSVSKVPNISFKDYTPEVRVNIDTMAIIFKITDGDADLGNDTLSGVYWKDSRYDSAGYTRADFPKIDSSIEDAKKGIEALCTFFPVPQPTPRLDSIHLTVGDTFTYDIYVVDRAGHKSNHITTPQVIVTPQ